MARKRKNKSFLIDAITFQPALALIVAGISLILAGLYVGHSNASGVSLHECSRLSVNNINSANPKPDQVAFMTKSTGQGGTFTAWIKAGSKCAGNLISVVTYKTPGPTNLPLKKQVMFGKQTKSMKTSVISLSAPIPACYYQLDLAYGLPLDLSTGQTYNSTRRLLAAFGGGKVSCNPTTSTPPPSSTPPPTTTSSTPPPTETTPPPTETTPPPTETTPPPDTTVPPPETSEAPPPGENPIQPTSTFLPDTGDSNLTLIGIALLVAGVVLAWYRRRTA